MKGEKKEKDLVGGDLNGSVFLGKPQPSQWAILYQGVSVKGAMY